MSSDRKTVINVVTGKDTAKTFKNLVEHNNLKNYFSNKLPFVKWFYYQQFPNYRGYFKHPLACYLPPPRLAHHLRKQRCRFFSCNKQQTKVRLLVGAQPPNCKLYNIIIKLENY